MQSNCFNLHCWQPCLPRCCTLTKVLCVRLFNCLPAHVGARGLSALVIACKPVTLYLADWPVLAAVSTDGFTCGSNCQNCPLKQPAGCRSPGLAKNTPGSSEGGFQGQ